MANEIAESKTSIAPFRPLDPLPPATNLTRAYAMAVAYVVGSTAMVALSPQRTSVGLVDYLVTGILVGTMFGQTTSASIWSALGTGHYGVRVALSIAWLLLLTAAVAVFVGRTSPSAGGAVLMIACCIILQSLFIQIPLWILRRIKGLSLRVSDEGVVVGSERIQFGIVHMMILTGIVAIVLGISQALIRWIGVANAGPLRELPGILYLALAAVLLSLPIATAILLDRQQWIAFLLAMLIALIVTGTEHPLMIALGLQHGGPDIYLVAFINVVTGVQVALFFAGLRWFGFRLTMGKVRLISAN